MKNVWLVVTLIIIVVTGIGAFFLFSKKKETKILPKPASETKSMLKITSPAFQEGGTIPEKYSCDGENVSPPLSIQGISAETKSLVLIVEDPDAPGGIFTHWTLWNIPPETGEIRENGIPQGALQGVNDFGKIGYAGPCPPSGTHRYFFKIFALDSMLDLSQGAKRSAIESATQGHVIDKGELVGKYSRIQ